MSFGASKQFIGLVDMLCEGPIQGLVDGKASVYINNIPFEKSTVVGTMNETVNGTFGAPTLSSSSGSTTATVSNITITDDDVGKFIHIVVEEVSNITITVTPIGFPVNASYMSATGAGLSTDFNTLGTISTYLRCVRPGGAELVADGSGFANDTLTINSNINRLANQYQTMGSWTIQRIKTFKIASRTNDTTIVVDSSLDALTNAPFFIEETRTISSNMDDLNGVVSKFDGSTVQFRRGTLDQAPIEQVNGLSGGITITGGGSGVALKQSHDSNTNSTTTAFGFPLYSTNGYPEDQTFDDNKADPIIIPSGTPSQGPNFGLSGAQKKQVDELGIRINYPALITHNNEGGDKESASAIYVFQIAIKGPGETNFGDYQTLFSQNGGRVVHTDKTTAAVSFDHTIGLNRFKPFDDFQIRIIRLTRDSGLPVWTNGTTGGRTDRSKWTLQAASSLNGADLKATIKDKFIYPFTAHAAVTFSSRTFNSLPTRSYLLQGLKVRIPTAYTPREYSDDGVAKYEAFWNGEFKKDIDGTHQLFYTDNPAWVFYDIVTNNRYGAGEWIDRNLVNKFALYRIAKYCDELVPDGKGGFEPRFRANLYLSKSAEVYKVLKDMATVFTGMLYWLDGKVTPVQDVPSDPVYTFSKANVVDGTFNYESSGRKTRSNQVVVTWNDPTANYEQVPLIVEDRENIVKTRKIISQKAVAMGATSEGQAYRYGRWKLFTAQNQKEVVSFRTGMQGAFIRPGDIINVQDRDRYGVDFSGVVKSIDTTSADKVVFDRKITALSGVSTYELSTIVTRFSAFYTGAGPLHINNSTGHKVSAGGDGISTFNRGDRFTGKFWVPDTSPPPGVTFELNLHNNVYFSSTSPSSSLVSQEQAEKNVNNAFTLFQESGGPLNSSGGGNSTGGYNSEPLPLEFKEHSYVVTKTVTIADTTINGETFTEATVSTDYDSAERPVPGTVWALQAEDNDEVQILGSKKEYKVLGIAPSDEKNTFQITGVEHFNEKFDAVDLDYALGATPSNVFPTIEDEDEFVPPPEQLYVAIDSDASKPGEELTISWTVPQETFTDSAGNTKTREYSFLDGFELHHTVPHIDSPIVTDKLSHRFEALEDNLYTFRVRTVSRKQNYSDFISTKYDVSDQYGADVPRIVGGLPKGIISSSTFNYSLDLSASSGLNEAIRFAGNSAAGFSIGNTLNQASSIAVGLSNVSVEGIGAATNRETLRQTPTWYWLLFDGGTGLAVWDTDSLKNLPFYRKIPSAGWRGTSQSNTSVWSTQTGTYTVAANSTRLKQGGNSFTCALRDIFLFENPNKLQANYVSTIVRTSSSVILSCSSNHNLVNGDKIIVEEVGGSTQLNGKTFFIEKISDTQVKLFTDEARTDAGAVTSSTITGGFTNGGWFRKVDAQAAKVTAVIYEDNGSDIKEVILDRSFPAPFSGTVYKAVYRPDYRDDAVFGRVRWSSFSNGANNFAVDKFITLSDTLAQGKFVALEATPDVIQYDTNSSGIQVQETTFTNIQVTATAIGFEEPQFKVDSATSNEFNQTDESLENQGFSDPVSGEFTKTFTLHNTNSLAYGTGVALPIKIEVREKNNVGLNAFGTTDIIRVKDGAEGTQGRTVELTAEDYSVVYKPGGTTPNHSGTASSGSAITLTATARNFAANPEFRFSVNGTPLQQAFSTTSTAEFVVPNTRGSATSATIEVEVQESGGNTVLATDSISIIFVEEGEGGVAISNPNFAHSITTEADGSFGSGNFPRTLTGSGTTLEVFLGGQLGTYVGVTSGAAFGHSSGGAPTLARGTWYIKSVAKSSNSPFTVGNITGVASQIVTIADATLPANTDGTGGAQFFGDDVETFTWTIVVGTATGNIETTTRQSISKSKKGAPGADSVTVLLDNDNVTVIDNDLSDTQATITVLEGTTSLTFANKDTGNLGAGEFNITITTSNGVNSSNSVALASDNSIRSSVNPVADLTGFTSDSGTRTLTINGKTADGTAFGPLTKVQTFTKVGSGTPGLHGLRNASGYIYFKQPSANKPSGQQLPTATDYSFTQQAFLGLQQQWSIEAPTFTAGASNNYWYVTWQAQEAREANGTPSGDTTRDTTGQQSSEGSLIFSSQQDAADVYQGAGFTGLVTFTSLQSSGSTQIDGSRITSGTIQAQRISLSSSVHNISQLNNDEGYTDAQQTAQLHYSKTQIDGFGFQTTALTSVNTQQVQGYQAPPSDVNQLNDAQSLTLTTAQKQQIANAISDVSGLNTLLQNQQSVSVNFSQSALTAGKLVLQTQGLILTKQTYSIGSQSTIVLDTTGGNNAMTIYNQGTARVILGKIS